MLKNIKKTLEQMAATDQGTTDEALAAILAKLDGDGGPLRKKPATEAAVTEGGW